MKKWLLPSMVCLAVWTGSAHADVSVSLSGPSSVGEANYPATGEVFASTEQTHDADKSPVDQAMSWRWDGEKRREIAQSFRTGDKPVSFDRMTFKTGGAALSQMLQNNPKIPFRLTIYRLPGADAMPSHPEAELVSEQVGSFDGFGADFPVRGGKIQDTAHHYLTFDFDPVKLDPDSYYAVVLSFMRKGGGQAVPLAQNAGNMEPFADGTGAFLDEEGAWKPCHDFYFYAESVTGR
jgi:hypothetical protein